LVTATLLDRFISQGTYFVTIFAAKIMSGNLFWYESLQLLFTETITVQIFKFTNFAG